MPANVEQCENCGKLIGSLETPWVDNEQVVCAFCWATSRIVDQAQTVKQTSVFKTAAYSPIASRLISAVTISAVAGLGGVAVFLARASAWWFHGWYRLGTTTLFLARRRSPASGTNRDRESLSFEQSGQAFSRGRAVERFAVLAVKDFKANVNGRNSVELGLGIETQCQRQNS